ncbi:MAG: PhoPQ-activated protein PqaA family protein, partial [Candidatus Caldarchaeum sp.]
MNRRGKWALAFAVAGFFCLLAGSNQVLLEYVSRPDPAFKWEKRGAMPLPNGVTMHTLRLTSQQWKGIDWTHTILVAQPPKITTSTALLLITGGNIGSEGDSESRLIASQVATILEAVVAVLFTVPNQPLFDNLTEDDLLAYTFVKVLETGDREWACLLPMTKSAIRAMDAVQVFCKEEIRLPIDGFVVTGASKRGWTTWLTAVADPDRVKAIAPMVYDNLNIPAQMKHQREVFGGYSEQISEYTRRGLTDLATTGKARPLVELIDPFSYRDRLTVPKLIINGTNDRYWTLDAANFYFNDLPKPRYLLYVPNSGHGLEDRQRLLHTLVGFFNGVVGRSFLPQMDWSWADEKDGAVITLKSNPTPTKVLAWTAASDTQDFRDSRWASEQVFSDGPVIRYLLKPVA